MTHTTHDAYDRLVAAGRARYPHYDTSKVDAAPQFKPYVGGVHIQVTTDFRHGVHAKAGMVVMTSSWQPMYLLRCEGDKYGHSHILGPHDTILAFQETPHGPFITIV